MNSFEQNTFLNENFPDGFQRASSSESFKVEEVWSEEGKGETIWNRFGHDNKVYMSTPTSFPSPGPICFLMATRGANLR
jgi:beta-glucosidase/6-phospho-beta-glucosidase/beta-galactosidase